MYRATINDYATCKVCHEVQIPSPQPNKKGGPFGLLFYLLSGVALCSMTFEVMSLRLLCDLRANNLRPK